MIDYYDNPMDITLVGSGFLGCYYFGAFSLLTQVWPNHSFSKVRGCSSGGIMAASAGCGLSITTIAAQFGRFTIMAKQLMMRMGLGVSMDQLVRVMLADLLPDNAHKLTSGRIDINLTRFWDFKNVKASMFETKQDLLDAIVAGCFIPFWSGKLIPPTYRGVRYMDGGWAYKPAIQASVTDDEDIKSTTTHDMLTGCIYKADDIKMTFSPFSGLNLDVCPNDDNAGILIWCFGVQMSLNMKNFIRMFNAFVPRHSSVYQQYIVQGHTDMKRCLVKNNKHLLKCQQCHSNSTYLDCDTACLRCLLLVEKVDNLKIPNEILEAYQNAARANSN